MAEVSVSERYQVPADEMWARIGDPLALSEWHPWVEATEGLDGGRVRVNTVVGGARVVETILEQADRSHTFRIDEGPLPYEQFVATLRVRDDGESGCVVEWEATFEPRRASETEAEQATTDFFRVGLDAL